MMEDLELTLGTVQDTLILPSSLNGEAVTIGAEASAVMKSMYLGLYLVLVQEPPNRYLQAVEPT